MGSIFSKMSVHAKALTRDAISSLHDIIRPLQATQRVEAPMPLPVANFEIASDDEDTSPPAREAISGETSSLAQVGPYLR